MSSFNTRLSRALALLLCWGLANPAVPLVWAQAEIFKEKVTLPGLQKKISLDLRQMDILEVLKFLAQQGDLNIVPTKNVGGRVTMLLNDVRLQDAFDLIMLTNELGYIQEGKIIQVMTEAEYQRLVGDPFADRRLVQQLHLRYANAADVAAILGNMKSGVGKIVADPTTGTLILVDIREKLDQMVNTARSLDMVSQPQDSHVFELKYAKAEVVRPEIEKVLSPKFGTVRMDKRTNTLIVTDLPVRMQEVRKIISAFDRKTREVTIEAKIIQVRLGDRLQAGVDWEAIFKDVSGLSVKGSLPIGLAQGGKVTVGTLAQDKFTTVLQFLQTLGTTDLLSTPTISVIENEEARILVGTKEVVVSSASTQTAQATSKTESITYVDVGIKLKVTPSINQDGFVTMKIKPEVSAVVRTVRTGEGTEVPVIQTSEAETIVMVRSGHTIVIAGLIKDTKTREEKRVPILGSIPLLGMLFRSRSDEVVREEIIFFLTPKVIEGEETASTAVPASLKAPSPLSPLPLRGEGGVRGEGGKGEGMPEKGVKPQNPEVLDVLKRLDKVLSSMREIVQEPDTNRKGEEQ